MTMWRRLAMLVLLAGSTGVLFADVAHAHTDTDVVAVPAGSTATVTFRPQHGCEGSPTITVAVRAPVPGAVAEEVEGWSASSTPEGDEFTVLEWVGGVLPADEAGAFPVEFVVPDAVGELLVFPAVQGCENGGELPWISGDPAAEFPAPRVLILAAGSEPAETIDDVPADAPGRDQLTSIVDVDNPSGTTTVAPAETTPPDTEPPATEPVVTEPAQRSGDHRNVGRDRHDRSGNGRHRIDRNGTDVRRRWRQRRRRVGRAVDPRWPRAHRDCRRRDRRRTPPLTARHDLARRPGLTRVLIHPSSDAKEPPARQGVPSIILVREGGLEPPRPFGHQHLKLARLPFRHSRKWSPER